MSGNEPVRDLVQRSTRARKLTAPEFRELAAVPLRRSFRTLLEDLSSIVRNTCRAPGPVERSGTFDLITTPTAKQRRALELIEQIAA